MLKKRAQGLSMTVIIVAIIALIVLAVVITIFSNGFGKFSGDVGNCAVKGGTCKSSCDTGNERRVDGSCDNSDHCCVKIFG